MLASLVLVLSVLTVLVALGRGRGGGADRPQGPAPRTLARDALAGAALLARLVERARG